MNTSGPLPRKADGLLVQELGDEVVVVDETTQQAHALSGLTAQLWRGIDAGVWPEAADTELDDAVAELDRLGLVVLPGLSRRRMLQRAGSVAVVGAVITVGLPSIAAAASTPVGTVPVPPAGVTVSAPSTTKKNTNATVTVTVLPVPSGGTPTGSVTLSSLAVPATDPVLGLPATQPLVNGAATFSITNPKGAPLPTAVTLTANYLGDPNYTAMSGSTAYVTTTN
jgi:hypothetical protein